jgi:protease-4
VIIAGYNYNELLGKIGVEPEVYATGSNKDILSMSRPRREDEEKIIRELVDETYNEFAEIVIKGRSAAGMTRERFEATPEVHDSRVLSGKQALEYGLVDELGYMEDAIAHVRSTQGLAGARVVQYVAPPTLLGTLLGVAAEEETTPKTLDDIVSGVNPEIRKGCMYFLSPMAY